MNIAALGVGFLFVTIGVILYSFQLPWIQFNPLPILGTFKPLYAFAVIFWWLGGIFVILGLSRSKIVQVLLVCIFSAIMLYFNLAQIASLVKT
jgi:hypothetical protein